jgi:hypothetical protein
MRHAALAVFAVLLALGGLAPAGAQEATPIASPEAADLAYPPDAVVAGATLAEWTARSAQWFLSFPPDASPFTDPTGERCTYGQHGPVFFLEAVPPEVGRPRQCTIPAGVSVLVPIVGVGCSTVEPPPFFGRDEAELRACTAGHIDSIDPAATPTLAVDGTSVPDVGRYRVQTAPFRVALPPDNFLGVPPTVATAVFEGYFVLLAPLAPGTHTVRFGLATMGEVSYDLVVAEPEVTLPETGTPAAGTPTP